MNRLLRETQTLSVDCGGGGIKAAVLDRAGTAHSRAVRVATPYPLPPTLLVDTIAQMASDLPQADRVSVGMPGMIRAGVVVYTPHYITKTGPRSKVLPELLDAWTNCDLAAMLHERLDRPVRVVNDAELHGYGVIAAAGLELALTLGTGLGSAHFHGGVIAPHLEMSHAPITRQHTYDDYIGEPERRRLGDGLWSRRVVRVIESLRPVYRWDRVYIGGGNSRNITPNALAKLGDDVVIVPNSAALVGGARLWELADGGPAT